MSLRHHSKVLDGVGDALFLKRNRESLQGRPKLVKGARSATNGWAEVEAQKDAASRQPNNELATVASLKHACQPTANPARLKG